MKLLVLDIDGTLVNSKKEITPATLSAIDRWRDAGNLLAIATGRPTAGVRRIAKTLSMSEKGGYVLSYNGACITDAVSGKRICGKILPPDLPSLLANYASALDKVGLISYEGDTVLSAFEPDDYIKLEAVTINHMSLVHRPNFAEYINFPVHKCLLTADPVVAERYEKEIAALTEGRVSVYRSEPFFIEVMPLNVDKASSLDEFIPSLGIEREDVVCCGDGYNDISMIRWAGLGVAMANAHPPVKEAADYVTLSCDEDGVAALIERLLVENVNNL